MFASVSFDSGQFDGFSLFAVCVFVMMLNGVVLLGAIAWYVSRRAPAKSLRPFLARLVLAWLVFAAASTLYYAALVLYDSRMTGSVMQAVASSSPSM